jgi:membrane protein YdbS with pleckstrin-like domain
MKELDKILNTDEKILWEGGPKFWPFFLGRSLPLTIFGIIWMGFMMIFVIVSLISGGPAKYFIFAMPHFWIGLFLLFGPPIYNFLVFKHTYYAITDKRVILQTGVIGRDFQIIDFNQVTNAEVNIGVFDKLIGQNTGSILISSAGSFTYAPNNTTMQKLQRPYTISNVVNPYDVFKFFKKVSYDAKTDIEYPNKFRPTENPGYKTDYDPNKKQ